VYDTVRAEIGSHYLVVDPQPDWMPDLMLGADGLHPTLAGTAEHADAIVAAFKSRVWQQMVRSAT
jgi:lysophospholipase L1-like esterase